MSDLVLAPLAGEYYVNRLDIGSPIPEPVSGELWSVTRTAEEISVVCDGVLQRARAEGPWSAFRVAGTLDFSLTGVLHRILDPLASARISIFALSTFDTDYILVPHRVRSTAIEVWNTSGTMITVEVDT